jgi:hypothetical protein
VVACYREMLAKIARTSQRVQKLSQRQQLYTDPSISKITDELQDKTDARSRGRRGKYNVHGQKRNQEEVPIHLDENEAVDGYFETAPKDLMLEQLREFYYFYERNMVPTEWHEAFEHSTQLGNGAKVSAAFVA